MDRGATDMVQQIVSDIQTKIVQAEAELLNTQDPTRCKEIKSNIKDLKDLKKFYLSTTQRQSKTQAVLH